MLESIIRLSKGDHGTTWCEPALSALDDWHDDKIPHDIFRMLNEGFAEMFFSNFVIFVEGPEDIAYLQAYWRAKNKSPLPHIIPVGGKENMLKPIKLAREFNINCFAVFDADREEASHEGNKRLTELLGIDESESFSQPVIEEKFAVWPDKIRETVASELNGFNIASLDKKPLKIAAEVTRVVGEGATSPSLDAIWSKIETRV